MSVGPIVVVGPRHELITPVHWTREEPPGAGPVAGLQAGLACLDAARLDAAGRADRADRVATPKLVLILGGDMPFVGLGLAELLAAATETQAPRPDAVIGQDTGGRDQYLLAVWRTTALRAALSSAAPNASLRSLYRGVAVLRRTLPDAATLDCDTPQELERARALWPIQPELG